jgi:hypothetical protein
VLLTAIALPLGARAAEHGDGEDSPLHQGMEAMGKAMRVLNRGLKAEDPATEKEAMLAALQEMQEHAVAAKVLVPASVQALPEAERPARLAAFRADLAAAIVVMLEMERAILADNWTAANDSFAQMRDSRKEGHEKYNPDEG